MDKSEYSTNFNLLVLNQALSSFTSNTLPVHKQEYFRSLFCYFPLPGNAKSSEVSNSQARRLRAETTFNEAITVSCVIARLAITSVLKSASGDKVLTETGF